MPARSSSRGSSANTRRRVAARRGRLADRQADLALRHGEARDRVHHQHHVGALVAEVLGDRGRGERRLDAHQRRLVGRRDDHDRARQAVAEVALDELAHLAAALADQAITLTSAVVERAIMPSSDDLPTPEPAKMPRRWPRPHGHERVERAHAERQRSLDPRALQRVGRRGDRSSAARRASSGAGMPSIGRPSPSITRPSSSSPTRHAERRPVAMTACPGRCPCISPSGISSVRPSRKPTTSAGTGCAAAAAVDVAHLADLGLQPGRLDHQPDQVGHAAGARAQVAAAQQRGGARERREPAHA